MSNWKKCHGSRSRFGYKLKRPVNQPSTAASGERDAGSRHQLHDVDGEHDDHDLGRERGGAGEVEAGLGAVVAALVVSVVDSHGGGSRSVGGRREGRTPSASLYATKQQRARGASFYATRQPQFERLSASGSGRLAGELVPLFLGCCAGSWRAVSSATSWRLWAMVSAVSWRALASSC